MGCNDIELAAAQSNYNEEEDAAAARLVIRNVRPEVDTDYIANNVQDTR